MMASTVALIVFSLILSEWISAPFPALASATEGHVPGKVRFKRRGGQIVRGSYIVRLADSSNSDQVQATAVETASSVQAMKQQMMASGAMSTSSPLSSVQVTPSLVFTDCIKGFVVTGVPDELFLSLHQIPGIMTVEPDMTVSIYDTVIFDDDLHSSNYNTTRLLQAKSQVTPWGIQRVKGPIEPNPNPNGRIFILDTGISPVSDLNVDSSLSKNYAGGSNSPSWKDGHGHGTHVAGTVAAIDNSINVVGVVPGASVVAIRVLDNSGSGTISNVIAGINYVGSIGKAGDIANLSLGGGFSSSLNAAVTNAAAKGIKFAIAAGNDARDANGYSPASASGANVYTVSCYDNSDTLCSFSNYGSVVDYSGPGLYVESLSLSGGTVTLSGTSMSTPHIAGLLFAGNIAGGGFIKADRDSTPDVIAVFSGPVLLPAAPLQKPLMPKATPRAPASQPTKPKPTPIRPVPKPIASKPKPSVPVPKPVNTKPKPTAAAPKPVKPSPTPARPVPKPTAPKPTPRVPVPKPIAPKPTPRVPVSKPIAPKPSPTRPVPKPLKPNPTPIAPVPMPSSTPSKIPSLDPSFKPSKRPSATPSYKPS